MVFLNESGQLQCQNCGLLIKGPMGVHDFINDCPQCRSGPQGVTGVPTRKKKNRARKFHKFKNKGWKR